MSETHKYILEIIHEHMLVCEKRFSEIKTANEFNDTEYGNTLLDAIVTRLQSIGENIKRIIKNDNQFASKYPEIEWDKIIRFRDFISHHYEMLDYEIVFEICKTDLPQLKQVILKELNS
jgi:uncharacterized protein with HEPN domain